MSADNGLTKMYNVVDWLVKQKDVEAFLEPVDWKTLGLIDYPIIIKQPMDLGTIKSRLESSQYTKHQQVADDIRLVWSNCKTYNQEGSYLFKIAERLSNKFEEKYFKIKNEEPDAPEDENQPPSLEDKRQFRANMYRITSEELGEVVKALEERSPEALDKVSNKDEIEINIDRIPPRTFHQVTALIKKKVPEKRNKKKKLLTTGDEGPPRKK